jgi:hypothetical protein
MSDDAQEFNLKRALLVVVISCYIFAGLVNYLLFSKIINSLTEFWLLSFGLFVGTIIGYGLRKYRNEQRERKKEIERYRKW